MENFKYSIKTEIFFGKNQIEKLGKEVKKYSNNVLLVYGKGSVKRLGIYDKTISILKEYGIDIFELADVDPNPRIESVYEGAKICRENNINLILALGGGSVIDCAKGIAAQSKYDSDIWKDCYSIKNAKPLKSAIPIATILTVAATGSEMNGSSVISNMKENKKLSISSNLLRPVFSILDPTYTFSLSKKQTAAGVVDIMSHLFEQYFSPDKFGYLQNSIIEALLKTVIKFAPIAMDEPENYEARANIMWSSSLALNNLVSLGKVSTDWACHAIEHELSAFYDITHGIGLGIITPYWMSYVLSDENIHRFVEYGKNIWSLSGSDEEIAKKSIEKTREFFTSLGIPSTLTEVGIDDKKLEIMASESTKRGKIGAMKQLDKDDVFKILKASL